LKAAVCTTIVGIEFKSNPYVMKGMLSKLANSIGIQLESNFFTISVGVAFKFYPYTGSTSCHFQSHSLCCWSLSKLIPELVVQTAPFKANINPYAGGHFQKQSLHSWYKLLLSKSTSCAGDTIQTAAFQVKP